MQRPIKEILSPRDIIYANSKFDRSPARPHGRPYMLRVCISVCVCVSVLAQLLFIYPAIVHISLSPSSGSRAKCLRKLHQLPGWSWRGFAAGSRQRVKGMAPCRCPASLLLKGYSQLSRVMRLATILFAFYSPAGDKCHVNYMPTFSAAARLSKSQFPICQAAISKCINFLYFSARRSYPAARMAYCFLLKNCLT